LTNLEKGKVGQNGGKEPLLTTLSHRKAETVPKRAQKGRKKTRFFQIERSGRKPENDRAEGKWKRIKTAFPQKRIVFGSAGLRIDAQCLLMRPKGSVFLLAFCSI